MFASVVHEYNKDPTIWLDGAIPPTPVSHPHSWGTCPCSCTAYPPLEFPLHIHNDMAIFSVYSTFVRFGLCKFFF
jgi:hypothetical protein